MLVFTPATLKGRYDLSEGVPLRQARFVFGSNYWLRRLADAKTAQCAPKKTICFGPYEVRVPQIDTSHLDVRIAEDELERSLSAALQSGEDLFATGCRVDENNVVAGPERIPRDRWKNLVLDFDRNIAESPGIGFVRIRVFKVPAVKADTTTSGQVSATRLQSWYIWYVGDCAQCNRIPSRDEDYAAATAHFGKSVPRSTLRKLRNELAPPHWKARGRRKANSAA